LNINRDFWFSCGHHLLDRGDDGGLMVTDAFLKAYLARPEVTPPAEACATERTLHQELLRNPRQRVAPRQIAAIADDDARENWQCMISWRDHLVRHATLEAAYLAVVRHGLKFPHLFINHLVQVILRNVLDDCDDAFELRAAELFFRAQRLTSYAGTLVAVDEETASRCAPTPRSPLESILGLGSPVEMDVLSEANAHSYWERSDSFDMALDLTAGRRGLASLGNVLERWVRHLLAVEVEIDAVTELRDVTLTWYVGLDADATRLGDALWNGEPLDRQAQERVIGLYRLTFPDATEVVEAARGAPTYLIAAMSGDRVVRLKPQNLITGLPVARCVGAVT
jgi:hypothetical protein